MLFVLVVSLRMIRQLARLYGGRPGALGMISLMRHVITNLAISGGMAATDSLVQQVLAMASRPSSRISSAKAC